MKHPERAPVPAFETSWSTPETRIKELETLLATERSARERAELALEFLRILSRQKVEQAEKIADGLTPAASSSETIQSSPSTAAPPKLELREDLRLPGSQTIGVSAGEKEGLAAVSAPDRRCTFIAPNGHDSEGSRCGDYAGHAGPHTALTASAFAQSSPSPTPESEHALCTICGKVSSQRDIDGNWWPPCGHAKEHGLASLRITGPSPRVPTTEPDK